MNETENALNPDSITPCRSTLRWLLVVNILFSIFSIAVSFLQTPFLPELLQQFERESVASPLRLHDVLFLCFAFPSLIFSIVVYIALWRGWRSGRRLYAISLVIAIPLCLMLGPRVESALLYTTEAAGCVIAGLILGLLYFSDLRDFYESPKKI